MPKKIIVKCFSGSPLDYSNPVGGHVVSIQTTATTTDNLLITEQDLNIIYNNYIQPFLNESPFYMGSNDLLTTIYSHIGALMPITTDNKIFLAYKIIQDLLHILLQSRDVHFDRLMLTNEITIMRGKYQMSEQKIMDLTMELMRCNALHEGQTRAAMDGTLGIKLHKPKNLIYAQAVLNINIAWYYYLHMKRNIDPRLYMATVEYVKTMGTRTDAYNKLIVLLDERFKTIDDVVESTTTNIIAPVIVA
jgi:hypothetical protein